jgi:hypothetical protein
MEIIKAEIIGTLLIPPQNEPYKKERLLIEKITHYYKTGGRDSFLNQFFGSTPEEEFYEILPNNCEVIISIKNRIYSDKYYMNNDFVNACFNKSNDNPYQLPDFTKIT